MCLKRKERPPKKNSNIPIEFGRKFSQFRWLLPDGISPCDHFLSRWDMWWCWLWPQVSNAQNPYNLWLNDHSTDWFIEILMINGLLESPYNWKVQSIYTANHQGFGHCSSGSSSPQKRFPVLRHQTPVWPPEPLKRRIKRVKRHGVKPKPPEENTIWRLWTQKS